MIANWKEKVGGMKESPVDPRDYQVSYKAISLPEEYNTNPSNYIHDQGSYNNCAAHALSSYIEILLKSEDKFKEVSFPWLYGNRRHTTYKDEGLISRDLLKASQKDGNLYLEDYSKVEEMKAAMNTFNKSYLIFKDRALKMKLGNYYQCTTIQEVKEAIYKYGSCMIGTVLFDSFGKVATGETLYMNEPIIEDNSLEPMVGGHMMIAVGWIKDYLIIQNSWGMEFGKNGYFYMPFSLATWNERTGFPISVFEAWAIDGIYLDDEFVCFNKDLVDEDENEGKPEETEFGWYQDNDNKWHYKLEDGKDAIGWLKDKSHWYFFEDNGEMAVSKWIQSKDGRWSYLKPTGIAACNQWFKINDRWYYFDENCYAIKGFRSIDGVDYYFAEKKFNNIKECECMVSSR